MGTAESSLSELFPESDYEFKLTLRRSEPAEFFVRGSGADAVRRERGRWLSENPDRYASVSREAAPLIEEFSDLAAQWPDAARLRRPAGASPAEQLRAIGTEYESDVLFLSADTSGHFRLRGGVLCFPTGWALDEKIGETLDAIHGVVPGLNAALGPAIQHFLAKLRPGIAYLRQNWGLAASDELNLHPARRIPPPTQPVRLDALWLRVEHQALFVLPVTCGIVFGIRIALHRLDAVAASPAGTRLRRGLVTMPDELAGYKRLDHVRADVIRLLS